MRDTGPRTERTPATQRERASAMASLREQGLSLGEVGMRFGLSRERVRQILQVHGGPAPREVVAARRRRTEQQLAAHADELLALWRSGARLPCAAEALGLTTATCREAIARLGTDRDRAERRANLARTRPVVMTYSDADIIGVLRLLADDLQRLPSASDYAPLGRQPGYPSLATIINRMDGWRNALYTAGLTRTSAPARPRPRRWTEQACWAALRSATADLRVIPTIAAYDRYQTGRTALPSSATLRNRLGRWSEMTTQLALERDNAELTPAPLAWWPRASTPDPGPPAARDDLAGLRRMRATHADPPNVA